jgi:Integrase core domain
VLRRLVEFAQYTSLAFGQRCANLGVRPSMGSVGDAYDNAVAESFFASLERELIHRRSFGTKAEARLALFRYIEGWYNPRRRHSALGRISPIDHERKNVPQLPFVRRHLINASEPAWNPSDNRPLNRGNSNSNPLLRWSIHICRQCRVPLHRRCQGILCP